MPHSIDADKKTERLLTLNQIGEKTAALLLSRLNSNFDYTGRVFFDVVACGSVNETYWEIVKDFKKYYGFGKNKINNPKIAALTLCAMSQSEKSLFIIEGERSWSESYQTYADVMYTRQLFRSILFLRKIPENYNWTPFNTAVKEILRNPIVDWRPIAPFIILQTELLWDQYGGIAKRVFED